MAPSNPPAVPRKSASLILLNRSNEVLLVHRNPKSTAFAGMHVFPGGNVDPQDESLQVTAIRETFEECGILLASPSSSLPSAQELSSARKDIHSRTSPATFSSFLSQHALSADIEHLIPFTQWITPLNVPKQFHTHFFLGFWDGGALSGGSQQQRAEITKEGLVQLPTSDGGVEIMSARFVHPLTALMAFHSGHISLMPPQYYLLYTLAQLLEKSTNDDRSPIQSFAKNDFGSLVIHPKPLPKLDDQGRRALVYQGDEKSGGPPGARHRSLVKFSDQGVPLSINLERNLPMFDDLAALDVAPPPYAPNSRL